ncbi:alpha/beta hydrolase [bacterium]|nr:alpha/beta hydrolase [bacterium]MCI0601440.1 alpha/beta hydrolase [bacterium]
MYINRIFFSVAFLLILIGTVAAEPNDAVTVSFPTEDGGEIFGDVYGRGDHALILAHGGRFHKGSWQKQARELQAAGFRVLAIDFRGYGQSRGPGQEDPMSAPLYQDLLAAVRYLRQSGAKTISIIGASMGGGAAADASIRSIAGQIERIVFLASILNSPPQKVKGRKLFIVAREDTRGDGVVRLVKIREQYEQTPDPKELIILEGSAHAQAIFETDQAARLMLEILRFLSAP